MRGKALGASLSWEESRFPEAHARHSTTTLFTALDAAADAMTGKCSVRHGVPELPQGDRGGGAGLAGRAFGDGQP